MIVNANELLNSIIQAIGCDDLVQKINKARAYYECNAYPIYGGGDSGWPRNSKGELVYPKVQTPLPRIIVDKSATFLMKRTPRFYVNNDQYITDVINWVIDTNEINFDACARTAGIEGGIWFKFILDRNDTLRPWKINILSVTDVIPVYNPHDITELVMVRVQYRYTAQDGKEYWYREEWTKDTYVQYEELPAEILDPQTALQHIRHGDIQQERTGPWKVKTQEENVFRIIPFQFIRNRVDPLSPNGAGDFWDLFDLFDRINVAYDNMDLSNQYGGGPVAVFFEADNVPQSLAPHTLYSITGPNARVELLEHEGNLRKAMEWYAEKLESFAYATAGIVNPKLEDVAGLGQLSYAALQLLHGPLIETTDKKRELWGKLGLCKFFNKMLFAMYNVGDLPYYNTGVNVQAAWPDYFPLGAVDKQIELANLGTAMKNGYPFEYAARDMARIMGITEDEISQFIDDVKADLQERKQIEEAINSLKVITGNMQPGLQTQAVDGSIKNAARKRGA
jgi:hypothetical protein